MLSSQHLATRNCSESAWQTADMGPDVWDDLVSAYGWSREGIRPRRLSSIP